MNYEIVNIEDMVVVGTSIFTTNEGGKSMADIGALWEKFIGDNISERINNKKNEKCIGLYADYESDCTKPYKFMCGREVTESGNSELETIIIKGGKYAKFEILGDLQYAVGQAWEKIWAMELERRYAYDFELYHNDSEDMSKQRIDIFISIE